jgi:transcriptional regulator with XRE-family HTH domain
MLFRTRLKVLRQVRGERLNDVLSRMGFEHSRSLAYLIEDGKRAAPESCREPWAAALGIEAGRLFDDSGRALPL